MFKIGTLADWFGVGLLDGIRASQQCGAAGVQIYAWNELDPRKATAGQIAQIKSTVRACAQEVTALCGELGGHGFEIAADNPEKVDYLKRTVCLLYTSSVRVTVLIIKYKCTYVKHKMQLLHRGYNGGGLRKFTEKSLVLRAEDAAPAPDKVEVMHDLQVLQGDAPQPPLRCV